MSLAEEVRVFRTDPHKVNQLRRILEDPVYKEALELSKKAVIPRVGKTPTIEKLAIQQTFSAGYMRGLESMEALAVLLESEPESLAEPFSEYFGGTANLSPDEIEKKVRRRKPKNPEPQ